MDSYIEKTIYDENDELRDIELAKRDSGQCMCGPGCYWRYTHSGSQSACFAFGAAHGYNPHPNCLGPEV